MTPARLASASVMPQLPPASSLDAVVAVAATLFGTNPDVVAVYDQGGALLYCNGANDLPAAAAEARQRVLANGTAERIELVARASDGTPGWMLLTTSPLRSGDSVIGVLQQGVDLSERRREEERLRRLEAVMVDTQGVAQLGIWEWDVTQPTATWSPGLYVIYGLTPETYTPSYEGYLERVHPEDRQRVMDATNKVFHQHEPYSHDERIFRADGTIRYLHTWAVPVLDESGKLLRLLGVCQDITDRKLTENALAEHAAELARSNVELEKFSHIASHDLQEPLRSVTNSVQLIERRYRGHLGDDSDEVIHEAVEGVKRMKALIDDTLKYSRLRKGTLRLAAFPLAAAVDRAVSELNASIKESGAKITIGELPTVRAEQALIVSLLQNLLSNAIKFRGKEAPAIRIDAGATEQGFVDVAVRDNGIGIAVAYRERVFEMFRRLDPAMPGTGIGLAICRRIVERHGGRIWIEGPPGAGAIFHFTLPLAVERRKP